MRTGRVRSLIDMQIAATVFQAGMMLVMRNVKDMEGAGVRLLNPFD
jgi:predicted nucleic acid-binding protein